MSNHDNGQVSSLHRPTTDDPEIWKAYWKSQGWPWRTEPEIHADRQKYLAERRAIVPNFERGIYPFKSIELNRADVEWLLATHENEQGPIDTNNKNQLKRKGLDLRGADLHGANLQKLPLARLLGALTWHEGPSLTSEQRRAAEIFLDTIPYSV